MSQVMNASLFLNAPSPLREDACSMSITGDSGKHAIGQNTAEKNLSRNALKQSRRRLEKGTEIYAKT
jgi:hypothetical protein